MQNSDPYDDLYYDRQQQFIANRAQGVYLYTRFYTGGSARQFHSARSRPTSLNASLYSFFSPVHPTAPQEIFLKTPSFWDLHIVEERQPAGTDFWESLEAVQKRKAFPFKMAREKRSEDIAYVFARVSHAACWWCCYRSAVLH